MQIVSICVDDVHLTSLLYVGPRKPLGSLIMVSGDPQYFPLAPQAVAATSGGAAGLGADPATVGAMGSSADMNRPSVASLLIHNQSRFVSFALGSG